MIRSFFLNKRVIGLLSLVHTVHKARTDMVKYRGFVKSITSNIYIEDPWPLGAQRTKKQLNHFSGGPCKLDTYIGG